MFLFTPSVFLSIFLFITYLWIIKFFLHCSLFLLQLCKCSRCALNKGLLLYHTFKIYPHPHNSRNIKHYMLTCISILALANLDVTWILSIYFVVPILTSDSRWALQKFIFHLTFNLPLILKQNNNKTINSNSHRMQNSDKQQHQSNTSHTFCQSVVKLYPDQMGGHMLASKAARKNVTDQPIEPNRRRHWSDTAVVCVHVHFLSAGVSLRLSFPLRWI